MVCGYPLIPCQPQIVHCQLLNSFIIYLLVYLHIFSLPKGTHHSVGRQMPETLVWTLKLPFGALVVPSAMGPAAFKVLFNVHRIQTWADERFSLLHLYPLLWFLRRSLNFLFLLIQPLLFKRSLFGVL